MSTADSKTVLITGAAGAIGLAAVSTFLETGMTVVGIDKSPSMPSADGNDRYIGLTADLTDEGSVVAGLDLLADVPELRHVVGIAGGALPGEPESQHDPSLIDTAVFRESLEQNLTSQFILLKAALPWLLKPNTGERSVTLTSSFNALAGYGMPAYSAAGLMGMMNALVGPLGQWGIRINCVAPGTIRTRFLELPVLIAHDMHSWELGSACRVCCSKISGDSRSSR